MSDEQSGLRYQAYLLRLWEERPASPGRPGIWRFSLEDPRTGQRYGFTTLEALMDFLRKQIRGERR
ncbi:MAG TPA: hypothetical protein ENG33_09120 [Chloroflexi bacterium]|nr:hypothetical protein [Chloroflexota bacterium]